MSHLDPTGPTKVVPVGERPHLNTLLTVGDLIRSTRHPSHTTPIRWSLHYTGDGQGPPRWNLRLTDLFLSLRSWSELRSRGKGIDGNSDPEGLRPFGSRTWETHVCVTTYEFGGTWVPVFIPVLGLVWSIRGPKSVRLGFPGWTFLPVHVRTGASVST